MAYTLKEVVEGGAPNMAVRVKEKETGIIYTFCLYRGAGVPTDINIGAVMRDVMSSKEYQLVEMIVSPLGVRCQKYFTIEVA